MIMPQADSPVTGFRPFFNPATGEWITYTALAEDSDGQLVRFHWRSVPGGVITEHIHPRQEERFTILAGEAHFTLNGAERVAGAGETVVVPAGVPHSEGNPGPGEINGVVELRPALHAKESRRALAGLVADGKTTPRGAPRNPLQLGATFWHFRHESRVTSPPIWAQNLMLPAVGAGEGLRRTPLLRPLGQSDPGNRLKPPRNPPRRNTEMNVTDPILRVSVISTGQVQIRPDHEASTWRRGRLVAAGLPALDRAPAHQRLRHRAPRRPGAVRHRAGPGLGHRPGLLSRRPDRGAVRPPRPVRDQPGRDPERRTAGRLGYAAGDVKTAVISHLHQDHIGGLAELSAADIVVSQAEWDTLSSPLPQMRGLMRRHIDLPGLRWHRIEPEVTGDPELAPFPGGSRPVRGRQPGLAARPGTRRLDVAAGAPGPGLPPLMMVGDLTYDAHLLETGHVPGVSSPAPPAGSHRHDQHHAPAKSGPGDPARS